MNGIVYVMVESIYSMDGDMAPLAGMQALVKKFGAYLIVDEAHAVGVYGDSGRGIVHARRMQRMFLQEPLLSERHMVIMGSHFVC